MIQEMQEITCIRHHGIMNEGVEISYEEAPVITKEDYENRIARLLDAADAYSHILIYADKEHFSNLEYVTGYDPRYEECMLLLKRDCLPWLIVGNEGMGQSQCITIAHEKILYQSLSPMGQARGNSRKLSAIFADYGIDENANVAVMGWKSFGPKESDTPSQMFEVPAYIIAALDETLCQRENGNWLTMDNSLGIRTINDVKTMILSEIASTKASRKTWNFMQNLKEGVTEIEASQAFNIDGEPCPTYPNICFYGKGILSPDYHRTLAMGAPIAFGMGYRYAQIHRVGMFARSWEDVKEEWRAPLSQLYKTYYKAVCVWFESLAIGVSGHEVWQKVKDVIGSYEEFGIALNPGHLIGTEEWMNSPFFEGSESVLKSGMLVQCDFTARPVWCLGLGAHIEDGLMIADEQTREQIKEMAPLSYARMMERQRFMREVLGIALHDEVLPTSDLCGILHPFMADTDCMMVNK